MSARGTKGLERLFKAFGFSTQSLSAAPRNEAAFRQKYIYPLCLFRWEYILGKQVLNEHCL